jgi:hypothetical protein
LEQGGQAQSLVTAAFGKGGSTSITDTKNWSIFKYPFIWIEEGLDDGRVEKTAEGEAS